MAPDQPTLSWSFPRDEKGEIFCFRFNRWKQVFLQNAFPEVRFRFAPWALSEEEFHQSWAPRIRRAANPCILIWGGPDEQGVAQFGRTENIHTVFVEDGFIRSASPHASSEPPVSLAFDNLGPHFSYATPSRLEMILAHYDFDGDPQLLERARSAITLLLAQQVTKYNSFSSDDLPAYLSAPGARKILVIGQVEDDAAMIYGSAKRYSNHDIVRLARAENPDAEVIYRVHPDVVAKVRPTASDPGEVASIARVMTERISITRVLDHVDAVYTITSLAGFEALLRGLPVTVFGAPFYAGWGATDDRQPIQRRSRKLSVEEIFAAAYLLYPTYFDRHGKVCSFESAIRDLKEKLHGGERRRKLNPVQTLAFRILEPAVRQFGSREELRMFRQDPKWFFLGQPHWYQRLIGRVIF